MLNINLIKIVDKYGTLGQFKEVPYDICVSGYNKKILYKHIPESKIID